MNQDHDTLLTVKDLTVKLQLQKSICTAVDRVSFQIKKGKTLALVGESGCGKSMTALSLLRLLPSPISYPPSGEIIFDNQDLLKLSDKEMRKIRGGKIGMIFQDPQSALNPVFRIIDQLLESVQEHLNVFGEEAVQICINALNEVGIPEPEKKIYCYPHELSGGMKQRVMIAMALIAKPDLLIADEPTTALDVTIQAQVLDLMLHLQEKHRMAILLITHDMSVVAKMADECLVMYATSGVEGGSVQEVFFEMSHPYTEALFRSRPQPSIKRGELLAIKGSVPPITNLPSGCRFHPRCPYVMPKCTVGEVPRFKIGDTDHFAACWLREKQ